MDNYATISQAKVNANLDTFNEQINARRTLSVYIRKHELCQEMAEDAQYIWISHLSGKHCITYDNW